MGTQEVFGIIWTGMIDGRKAEVRICQRRGANYGKLQIRTWLPLQFGRDAQWSPWSNVPEELLPAVTKLVA